MNSIWCDLIHHFSEADDGSFLYLTSLFLLLQKMRYAGWVFIGLSCFDCVHVAGWSQSYLNRFYTFNFLFAGQLKLYFSCQFLFIAGYLTASFLCPLYEFLCRFRTIRSDIVRYSLYFLLCILSIFHQYDTSLGFSEFETDEYQPKKKKIGREQITIRNKRITKKKPQIFRPCWLVSILVGDGKWRARSSLSPRGSDQPKQ